MLRDATQVVLAQLACRTDKVKVDRMKAVAKNQNHQCYCSDRSRCQLETWEHSNQFSYKPTRCTPVAPNDAITILDFKVRVGWAGNQLIIVLVKE